MSAKRYKKNCKHCRQIFTAKSAKGKFCSPKCRLKHFKGKRNTSSEELMERLTIVRTELDRPMLHKNCSECKKRGVPFFCPECERLVTKCYDAFELNGKQICLWCWCEKRNNNSAKNKIRDYIEKKKQLRKWEEEHPKPTTKIKLAIWKKDRHRQATNIGIVWKNHKLQTI